MEEKQLLCAFGTLKKGFHNHRLIEGSHLIGKGVTREKYLMTTVDKKPIEPVNRESTLIQTFEKEHLNITPFPYILDNVNRYFVEVELYLITLNTLSKCDRLEYIPYFYIRKTIDVLFDGQVYQGNMYFFKDGFLKEWQ